MKHLKLAIRVTAGLLTAAAAAQAQEKKGEKPKPGPEVQRLAVFAGKWTSETDVKESPFGPAGKMKGEDDCKWFEGGFQLLCDSSGTGPMGPVKGTYFLAYKPEEKVYFYAGVDSTGMAGSATGTVSGKTWTWSAEEKMGGKPMKSRYTIVETSPTSYTFKWETSSDGQAWTTVMEGKSTKK